MKRKLFFVGLIAATAITVGIRVARVPVVNEVLFHDEGNAPPGRTAPLRSGAHTDPNTSVLRPDQGQSKPAMVATPDPVLFSDIPDGAFKTGLKKLKQDVQERVLDRLSKERQLLVDIDSIRVDSNGMIYYVCSFDAVPTEDSSPSLHASPLDEVLSTPMVSESPPGQIPSPPVLHSQPGASRVLFLDFDGHEIEGTAWNINTNYQGPVTQWKCLPYSTDSDSGTFSETELINITQIWQRVAEDYAPFDVDVTTEQPANWSSETGHALITPTTDGNGLACPHYGLGGVAYVDVFSDAWYSYNYWSVCYSPAWVNGGMSASSIAEAASHELGHNLGLHHDGTSSAGYYSGHSNGSISWAPIMGTGYSRNITQWSKGEYYLANNSEDDLVIIKNKLQYRSDDHGNENGAATFLSQDSNGAVIQEGVIETTGDTDVFSFFAGGGSITIEAASYEAPSSTWGGNLDIRIKIFNSSGTLVASANPVAETGASITTNLAAGTYYLHITPTALGNPMGSPPTGYTDYAVLGQYSIAGLISSDIDGDGLPNDWEQLYFGGYTNAVATLDDDNDGADNLTEYISGHNPKDPASVFKIIHFYNISPTASTYVVTWSSVAGRVYNVGWSDDLTAPFIDISGNLPFPASSYTDTVYRAGEQQFYRIEIR